MALRGAALQRAAHFSGTGHTAPVLVRDGRVSFLDMVAGAARGFAEIILGLESHGDGAVVMFPSDRSAGSAQRQSRSGYSPARTRAWMFFVTTARSSR